MGWPRRFALVEKCPAGWVGLHAVGRTGENQQQQGRVNDSPLPEPADGLRGRCGRRYRSARQQP